MKCEEEMKREWMLAYILQNSAKPSASDTPKFLFYQAKKMYEAVAKDLRGEEVPRSYW